MTAFHSTQLGSSPAANNNCNHPRIHPGLDRAYCPDCKGEFKPHSKEYQNALRPSSPVIPATECKVGDRVSILREPPQAIYQIVKLSDDGHATVEALDRNTAANRRRIAIWKLRPSCALPEPASSRGRTEQLLSGATHEQTDVSDHLTETTHEQTVDPNARPVTATHEQKCSCVTSKPPTHEHCWVQKYWVRRGNTKHQYFRFCYQPDPTNISSCVRAHIPGGNVGSCKAQENMAKVREAIAAGQSPAQIIQLIKSKEKHQ